MQARGALMIEHRLIERMLAVIKDAIGKKSKESCSNAENRIVNQTFSPNSPARVALGSSPPFSFLGNFRIAVGGIATSKVSSTQLRLKSCPPRFRTESI
jgi:hypothetical protein